MRVLGVDPGLTRCGVGIVDVRADRHATFVAVEVIRTDAAMPLAQRLLTIGDRIEELIDEHEPDVVALEQVFAQANLSSVMGVANISGIVLREAARRGISTALHTPTEVKAALTGFGQADKHQLAAMVVRILGLASPPKPADASDALALAVCAAWRGGQGSGGAGSASGGALTPAQQAWRAAERRTMSEGRP